MPIKETLIDLFTNLMEEREQKGLATYGMTLDFALDSDYNWDQMLIEELLDALQYQQKEIRRLKSELQTPYQCGDCAVLHSELQKQQEISFHLRRRITKLQGELRFERVQKGKLIKEARQHYRNGRKRGRNGRNG